MIIYKKCRVVMLPTEKASGLYLTLHRIPTHYGSEDFHKENTLLKIDYEVTNLRALQPQHIYVVSDDKIKAGDWFLYDSKFICKAELINEAGCYILTHLPNGLEYECNFGNRSKKIIATTDKLEISHNFDYTQLFPDKKDFRFYLPQPSEEFIDKFIGAYNFDGSLISEVNVEYEEHADCGSSMCKHGCKSEDSTCSGYSEILVVNPMENTIKISIPNIKKEFVPYNLALKLKQLGFTEPCFGRYSKGELAVSSLYYFKSADDIVNAPTFSQTFRWLRENHNLDGETCRYNLSHSEAKILGVNLKETKYVYLAVVNGEDFPKLEDMTLFISREEAELACLDKLLEIVEQKQK